MDNNIQLHPLTRWRLSQSPPLSVEEVAARARIGRTSLSKLETGARDHIDNGAMGRLADLGIDLRELLDWRWTSARRRAAKRVLIDAARKFRARAAAKRRKSLPRRSAALNRTS